MVIVCFKPLCWAFMGEFSETTRPSINDNQGSNGTSKQTLRLQNPTRLTMYVKHNIDARSRCHYYRGTTINITQCQYVFLALVIQRAKSMRLVILSSVACPALQYFSTLSYKRKDYIKKKLLNIKCVLLFSLQFFFPNISYTKKNSARYYHIIYVVQQDTQCGLNE